MGALRKEGAQTLPFSIPWSMDRLFADDHRLRLCLKAQLRRLKSVGLRHGVFRTVDAVENQLAEDRLPHLTGDAAFLFPLAVDQNHLVGAVVCANV